MDPVLIVGGPETGRLNDFIRQSRQRCAKEWGEDPEEHRIYAQDTPVPKLLDLLMNGSLFATGKFVQYIGADQVKSKDDVRALASYARKPAEKTVLILVSDSLGVDKLIEDAISKDAKKIFWELSTEEMGRWIRNYFSSQGMGADETAIEALLELVDNNTETLRIECSRLSLFFPQGARLTEADIEEYVAHNRAEDAFSLFDRMATGSFEQALDVLAAIIAGKESSGVGLMAGLLWCFRRLSSLHDSLAAGSPYEQAARGLRITRRSALAVHDQARRRWTREVCSRLVAFGVEIDVRLRATGQVHERILLELFIYACMVVKGPVALESPTKR